MFQFASRRLVLLTLLMAVSSSVGIAAQRPIVSSMKNVRAVKESQGYFITPSYTSTVQVIAGDEAPVQAFEVVRPTDSRVTLGRLFTSCSCIQLEAAKTTFERGEPVALTLRNVKPTPPSGQTYAIYVQVTSPVRTTLRYDTFVRSDRFIVSEPMEVASAQSVDTSAPEHVTLPVALDAAPELSDQVALATGAQSEAQNQAPKLDANIISEESLQSAASIVSDKDVVDIIVNAAEVAEEEPVAGDQNKAASPTSNESLKSI